MEHLYRTMRCRNGVLIIRHLPMHPVYIYRVLDCLPCCMRTAPPKCMFRRVMHKIIFRAPRARSGPIMFAATFLLLAASSFRHITLRLSLSVHLVFCFVLVLWRGGVTGRDTTVTIDGHVSIRGNSAGYEGGAIYTEATLLTIPADARISDNTAIIVSGGSTACRQAALCVLSLRFQCHQYAVNSLQATRMQHIFSHIVLQELLLSPYD